MATGSLARRTSAGILLYRRNPELQVLLGRMGGPFWQRKQSQNWSIPKGEYGDGESALAAARREFTEELGLPVPEVELVDLGSVTQRGGKVVQVYAGAGEVDPSAAVFGTFELEWPPHSGRLQQYPELAEVAWLTVPAARDKLVAAQVAFLDRLIELLGPA
jgi:predicted NUDIX family NTP pyrophosphohydrolase